MEKNNIVLHPFLLAIFPIISLFSANISKVPPKDTILPLCIVLIFSLIIFLLFRIVLKNAYKAGILTSLFFILFFSFGHLCRVLNKLPFYKQEYFIFIEFIILFVLGFYLVKKAKIIHNLNKVINIIAAVLVFIPLSNIIFYGFQHIGSNKIKTDLDHMYLSEDSLKNLPNIYYIILDGHARSDILKEIYKYSDHDFMNFLKSKGFYVANKSYANYCQSLLSLPSSLNHNYLDKLLINIDKDSADWIPLFFLWRNNKTFNFLRKYGYKIITFDAQGWNDYLREEDVDILYKTPGIGLMNSFQGKILNITPIPFVFIKLLKKGTDTRYAYLRKRILYAFEGLVNLSDKKGPFLVFAHLLTPHQPLLFGKDGEFINPDRDYYTEWYTIPDGRDRKEYIRKYKNQLAFIDRKTEEVLNKILNNSIIKPIIVLQSDHGPSAYLDPESAQNTYLKERMAILNAYYFPNQDYSSLYEGISPVNSFRVIFNNFFDMDFKLLEDKNYFSTWSKPYRFTDVTSRLN